MNHLNPLINLEPELFIGKVNELGQALQAGRYLNPSEKSGLDTYKPSFFLFIINALFGTHFGRVDYQVLDQEVKLLTERSLQILTNKAYPADYLQDIGFVKNLETILNKISKVRVANLQQSASARNQVQQKIQEIKEEPAKRRERAIAQHQTATQQAAETQKTKEIQQFLDGSTARTTQVVELMREMEPVTIGQEVYFPLPDAARKIQILKLLREENQLFLQYEGKKDIPPQAKKEQAIRVVLLSLCYVVENRDRPEQIPEQPFQKERIFRLDRGVSLLNSFPDLSLYSRVMSSCVKQLQVIFNSSREGTDDKVVVEQFMNLLGTEQKTADLFTHPAVETILTYFPTIQKMPGISKQASTVGAEPKTIAIPEPVEQKTTVQGKASPVVVPPTKTGLSPQALLQQKGRLKAGGKAVRKMPPVDKQADPKSLGDIVHAFHLQKQRKQQAAGG